jgi:hypothetical protein
LFDSLSLELATEFSIWKTKDMDYTRNVLSADANDVFWNYWIHHVDMTKIDYPGSLLVSTTTASSTTASDDHYLSSSSAGDLPPLFLKHQQMLYYCIVIVGSVIILYRYGVKLWEKY